MQLSLLQRLGTGKVCYRPVLQESTSWLAR